MKLIDADEVQKILKHIRGKYVNRLPKANQLFWDTIRYIEKKVRSIPTVEAKELVHAKWIDGCCSNCGAYVPTDSRIDFIDEEDCKFCYECGADMRERR